MAGLMDKIVQRVSLPAGALWAPTLAFFGVSLALHFIAPAYSAATESMDIIAGKISYCNPAAPAAGCIQFSLQAWLAAISCAIASIGLLASFLSSAATAWTSQQKRFPIEFGKYGALSLAAALAALSVNYLIAAWRWQKIFPASENVLFNIALALACALASFKLYSSSKKLSKGEAISVEIHRHAQ